MNYQISTGLILQEFNDEGECPLCKIQNIIENQLTDQFLSEAVMVDDYRDMVNKRGFCNKHTRDMFLKPSKLSLALQHMTRMQILNNHIKVPKTNKEAKAQAKFFKQSASTCIICYISEGNMRRYYRTVAEMFDNEPEFENKLKSTNGFCYKHFGELLEYSTYAKSAAKSYRKCLAEIQQKNGSRLIDELQWFCDKHDYRNDKQPWKNSKDALLRSIYKLHGIDC